MEICNLLQMAAKVLLDPGMNLSFKKFPALHFTILAIQAMPDNVITNHQLFKSSSVSNLPQVTVSSKLVLLMLG